MISAFQYMDTHGRILDADVAAAVFGQAEPGAFHLPHADLTHQLLSDFVNLEKKAGLS